MRTQIIRYPAKIPPARCTQELLDRCVQFAREHGLSMAELQRSALQDYISERRVKSAIEHALVSHNGEKSE